MIIENLRKERDRYFSDLKELNQKRIYITNRMYHEVYEDCLEIPFESIDKSFVDMSFGGDSNTHIERLDEYCTDYYLAYKSVFSYGFSIPKHIHPNSDQVITVTNGSFIVIIEDADGEVFHHNIDKGDVLIIPNNSKHRISSKEENSSMIIEFFKIK